MSHCNVYDGIAHGNSQHPQEHLLEYNLFDNTGNGFTFDRYESGLLYDAINRAKTLYFENRKYWDEMVVRDMNKDVSWQQSAKQYKDMYVELTPR